VVRQQSVAQVVIIHDEPLSRAGLERVLADQPDFTVAASVPSVEEIDWPDGSGCYDVAVLGLARDSNQDSALIAAVSKIAPAVVAADWDQADQLVDAIRSGARACVTRTCGLEELMAAVRLVIAGALVVSPELVERLQRQLGVPHPVSGRPAGLAPREVETVRLIALGLTQRQIAVRMRLSEATVNTYAKSVRRKLLVNNKAQLTRAAIELGLVGGDGLDIVSAPNPAGRARGRRPGDA